MKIRTRAELAPLLDKYLQDGASLETFEKYAVNKAYTRRFYSNLSGLKYGRVSRRECENSMAWALGYQMLAD